MEPVICRVSVVINPSSSDQSFSIRYGVRADSRGSDQKTLIVKFILQTSWQINFVVSELEKLIDVKQPCDVEFNLSKCPQIIRDNNDFKEKVRNIFYPRPETAQFATPIPQENRFPPSGFTFGTFGTPNLENTGTPIPHVFDATPSHTTTPAPLNFPLSGEVNVNEYIDMSNVNVQRANRLVPNIHLHIREHGANPDLSAVHTLKGRKKIWNYIKSASAAPDMRMDEALYIASRVLAMH